MSWREQLQPASYRGVAFHVVSTGGTFGRRTVLHQFPFRDIPFAEDMGRLARKIRIEAIILGADYMTTRDALVGAAEQAGPGKLVHPYFGELTVSVTDDGIQIDESTDQGGMCRVSFSCVETGEARFPTALPATQDLVGLRADEGLLASANAFSRRFSLDNLPAWAQQLSLTRAQTFLDRIRSAIAPLAAAAVGRGSVFPSLDALSSGLTPSLRGGAPFISQVQQLVGDVRGGLDTPTAVHVLGVLGDYGLAEAQLPLTTPTRIRDQANRDALTESLRATLVIERARAVADLEFRDFREAQAVRDSVVAQIDQVADNTADDGLFDVLTSLRAAVVRDVDARGANLARVVTVTPISTMPVLVLAYDLYQDATRDGEIIERNRITHPGFAQAGVPLEVLSDV